MEPKLDARRLGAALETAAGELLAQRSSEGFWVGELSSSALSTATAVCALAIASKDSVVPQGVIERGLQWLATHSNPDGGWGDTTLSISNLSTTTLCWAAFGSVAGADKKYGSQVRAAEAWISKTVGGLEAEILAPAIISRYGRDRTFSVPILTMCALAGRLGRDAEAWRWVKQLPFELAACPPGWFAALRLPVVSYALPALIAIGQARHRHLPSRNPFARVVRYCTGERTLEVLERIQPSNGGFLEATPLTSFVTMSLAGSGLSQHPVCKKGIQFLLSAQRPDGSWPIDTNLGTWITTLSVNALGERFLNPEAGARVSAWLRNQQYRQDHPYTNAAPGGWAWTDLPGGVPDADDTAGALLALGELADTDGGPIENGLRWLLDLQNKDGGIPTFCRGWGALPFDRSGADITAHAVRAWLACEKGVSAPLQRRLRTGLARAIRFLERSQRSDGSWAPLWFGNQFEPNEHSFTYGTARVVIALKTFLRREPTNALVRRMLERGLSWLVVSQNNDGSWGGFAKGPPSIEETALALEALAESVGLETKIGDQAAMALRRGAQWLVSKVESGEWKQASPIGFYFARLWYFEKLYPLIFTVAALRKIAALEQRI